MEKIRLELVGVTYNQIESGVYAVVLQQTGTNRRIPIIIGFPEAQAIECKLQEVITPRPLTHDLMVNVMSSFGIFLQEVVIYKMNDGVFGAELILSDGINTHTVDSRSSDAIALAIRVDAPIYTTAAVLEESGFDASEKGERKKTGPDLQAPSPRRSTGKEGSTKSISQLQKEMQQAAENENYEEASRLKELIEKLKAEKEGDRPE